MSHKQMLHTDYDVKQKRQVSCIHVNGKFSANFYPGRSFLKALVQVTLNSTCLWINCTEKAMFVKKNTCMCGQGLRVIKLWFTNLIYFGLHILGQTTSAQWSLKPNTNINILT